MPRKLFLASQETYLSLSSSRSLFCSLSTRYRVLLIFLEWLALSNRHYRNEEIQYSEKILRIRAARNEFPSDLFRARYNRKVGKSKGLYRNTISLSNSGNLEPRLRQAKIDSLREIGYATTGRLYNNNEQHACTRFSRG